MSFLFRAFAGKADSGSPEKSSADAVEKLLHRLESVTFIADRRDGLRALKDISKDHRLDIAAHGMDILLNILEQDRTDQEVVNLTLEILCIIMSDSASVEKELSDGAKLAKASNKLENKDPTQSLAAQFTEIFLKKKQHLSLLLDFVKEYTYKIRYPAVRLLCVMSNNSPKAVQDALCSVGGGVSNLMDLLTDNREIIRNDGVLLLFFITRNNPNLQKIVAFGKAFDTLLDIVRDEGCSEGGVVVEDCLLLISNLLTNNASNIKLFKEDGCINKLCTWYANDKSNSSTWSDQRKTNAIGMLGVIRNLVSPALLSQVVKSCQDAVNKCGLLGQVCDILMTPGVPLNVLVQALSTVAELIRGNVKNQESFAAMEAPLKPPRPALAILLLSMFNERQAFDLRLAVLYVLKSFLLKNEPMQLTILKSLVPDGASQYTLGQLLGGALFSTDPLNQWCSAISFLHCLLDNNEHKKRLLEVQFSPSPTLPTCLIIQQCGQILREGTNLQSKIGVLQLLCVWLNDCPEAVTAFLHIDGMKLILLAQIVDTPVDSPVRLFQGLCSLLFGICIHYNGDAGSRTEMVDLVRNRIGFDTFKERIVQVSRHENFGNACQHPDPVVGSHDALFLDYDFIKFFKTTEGPICDSLDPSHEDGINGYGERKVDRLTQQKDAIILKDERIAVLENELKSSHSKVMEATRYVTDLTRRVNLLSSEILIRDQEIQDLHKELKNSQSLHNTNQQAETEERFQLRSHMETLEATVQQLQGQINQYQTMNYELEQLRTLVSQQQEQINSYYAHFETLQQQGDPTATLVLEKADLTAKLAHLDALLFSWQSESSRLTEEVGLLKDDLAKKDAGTGELIQNSVREADERCQRLQNDLERSQLTNAELSKEHSDLLEFLTESDLKMKTYRDRLRRLGQNVSDDDDE